MLSVFSTFDNQILRTRPQRATSSQFFLAQSSYSAVNATCIQCLIYSVTQSAAQMLPESEGVRRCLQYTLITCIIFCYIKETVVIWIQCYFYSVQWEFCHWLQWEQLMAFWDPVTYSSCRYIQQYPYYLWLHWQYSSYHSCFWRNWSGLIS